MNTELRNNLLKFALPIAFQQFMLALVSASDAFMLGGLKQESLSAVSLASQVTFVYNLILTALTIGENMFVAQYYGKKDFHGVRIYAGSWNLLCFFRCDAGIAGHSEKLRICGKKYGNQYSGCPSQYFYERSLYLWLETNSADGNCRCCTGDSICKWDWAWNGRLDAAFRKKLKISWKDLRETSTGYLKWMPVMSSYYVIGKAVNSMTIGGIFPADGDTLFGLKCDAVTMWCFAVPLGYIATFVGKLPVIATYFVLNLDEIVKLPVVFLHYRQYKWVKNLTEREK